MIGKLCWKLAMVLRSIRLRVEAGEVWWLGFLGIVGGMALLIHNTSWAGLAGFVVLFWSWAFCKDQNTRMQATMQARLEELLEFEEVKSKLKLTKQQLEDFLGRGK